MVKAQRECVSPVALSLPSEETEIGGGRGEAEARRPGGDGELC